MFLQVEMDKRSTVKGRELQHSANDQRMQELERQYEELKMEKLKLQEVHVGI